MANATTVTAESVASRMKRALSEVKRDGDVSAGGYARALVLWSLTIRSPLEKRRRSGLQSNPKLPRLNYVWTNIGG
jgi:hypothetical protein